MLCKRNERELQSIIKLMGNEKFVIEEKLDGERIQLHKIGDTYKYVSRYGVELPPDEEFRSPQTLHSQERQRLHLSGRNIVHRPTPKGSVNVDCNSLSSVWRLPK